MPPLAVEITLARAKSLKEKISFSSQIESLYDATIEPRIDGYLISAPYSYGEIISKGDIIFTIDPKQLNTTLYAIEAELVSNKAQLAKAQNDYQRAVPLSKIEAISQSDLDQYRASLAAAKAAVHSTEQRLQSAMLDVGYTQIKAPIDGLIARTTATTGDYVGPSTAFSKLTTISYIDTVMVALAVPSARYIEAIRGTKDAALLSEIKLKLSDSITYSLPGEYYYTKMDASAGNSTIIIVAKFPNPDRILRAGMFARVNASIGQEREVVLIPQKAISQNQGINSVWVMAADSTVSYRKISLGRCVGEDWIVTSGLTPGERVLLSGQMKMHEKMRVKPISK